jgi:hypothetical protein
MGGKDHGTKAEPGFVKRRNRISGQFRAHMIEMIESPAWRALSLSARRLIDRIEIELAHHGGNDNGRLPVTKRQFMDYGMSDRLVAPAIREAQALGFIRVTERGRGGNSEYRQPNLFFLTFAHCQTSRAEPPTHDWRKIKTIEEAEAIAAEARAAKDASAVALGRRKRIKNRLHPVEPVPATLNEAEKPDFPATLSEATGSGYKVKPLSISGVGARSPSPASAQSYAGYTSRYPKAMPTKPYSGYSSLPVELRFMALGLPFPKDSLACAALGEH